MKSLVSYFVFASLFVFVPVLMGKGKPNQGGGGGGGGGDASPANPALAFMTAFNSGDTAVSVMDSDGSNPTVVVPGGSGPSWSPDGEWLAFCHRPADTSLPQGVYVSNLAGTDVRVAAALPMTRSRSRCTSWSPDGRWIAFADDVVGNDDLWLVEVTWDENGTPQFFSDPVPLTDSSGRTEWSPDWSPDSSQLVATVFTDYADRALYVMDLIIPLDLQELENDCLYPSVAGPGLPCISAEIPLTGPEISPRIGTWAHQHNWVVAGRVDLTGGDGTADFEIYVIDVSDLSSPVLWGPLGEEGRVASWDPADQGIAIDLYEYRDPTKKGKKAIRPEGIYRIDLGITWDMNTGEITGLNPASPVLLIESGNDRVWAPAWRPCYPNCSPD